MRLENRIIQIKNIKKVFFLLSLLIIMSTSLFSRDRIVPTEYHTINAAIAASVPGDHVIVYPVSPYNPYAQATPLDVPSGVMLILQPGVELHILQRLNVYGTFESIGTPDLKVYIYFGSNSYMGARGKVTCHHTIFAAMPGVFAWAGISLLDINASNSTFDHCDISGVLYADAGAALAIHYATNVTVSYCKISNLSGYSSYTTSGIYVNNSQIVNIFKNLVQDNSNIGILAHNVSYVTFGPSPTVLSCGSGNNIITGNSSYGIHANYNCIINLSPPYNFNNISNNGNYDAVVWIDSATSNYSIISAVENYWGTTPKVYGNVFWSPVIACEPNLPRLASVGAIEDNNNVSIGMLNKVTNTASIDELLQTAFNLLDSKNYDDALTLFKSIILTHVDNERVYGHALVGISAICKIAQTNKDIGDHKELLEYLKVCSKSEEALPIAKIVYASTLSGVGYYDEAILEYEAIAKSYHGTDYELRALVGISSTYLFNKQDIEKAREILEEVEKVAKVLKKEDDLSVKFLRGMVNIEIRYSSMDAAYRVLETAINLLSSGNYAEALNIYKLIIETPELENYDSYKGVYGLALSAISAICRTAYTDEELGLDYKEILEYLKAHTKDDENATINHKVIYAGTLAGLGLYYEALSEFEELLEMATITDYDKQAILTFLKYIRLSLEHWDRVKAAELLGKIENLERKINNGTISSDNPTDLPTDYSLSQNYPNPFNPTTTIQYAIPKDEFVKLTLYDMTGKVVKELVNGHKAAARYSVEFNASSYSSGIYYYKIEAGQYNSTQKMMLIK